MVWKHNNSLLDKCYLHQYDQDKCNQFDIVPETYYWIVVQIISVSWNLQHIQFATHAICNICNVQHVQFATLATCNMCNLKNTPISTMEVKIVSRVIPHLRGERGWGSCHSSGSLEGGCPSSAEVIEDTEDFIQFADLYSLFLKLRDLHIWEISLIILVW